MKILCIGRNYPAHVAELGNNMPDEPVIFCKPDSAILAKRHPFIIPSWTQEVHHELEWVLRIGKVGKTIDEDFAWSYVDAMTVGIDFTARDIQRSLKAKGLPWEKSKGFDGSAAIGQWMPVGKSSDTHELQLDNQVGMLQKGNTRDMLFTVNQLIAHASRYFTLKTGDILFTGTPSGVAAVKAGDRLTASLDGTTCLQVDIR